MSFSTLTSRSGGRARDTRGRSRTGTVLGFLAVLALVATGVASMIAAGHQRRTHELSTSESSGVIDFTTYSPPAVGRVTYRYTRGQLRLGVPNVLAHLPGADGIAYTPSGELIVGGQTSGRLFLLSPSGQAVKSVSSGSSSAFLIALSPSGDKLYTAGLPGPLAEVPLNPLGNGRGVSLQGDDSDITDLAFGPSGQVVYTASGSDGRGEIGLLDLHSGTTHRLFTSTVGAHGVMFDRFTSSYFVIGGDSIIQISSSDPTRISSEVTMSGMQFDQGAVTNQGTAFFASNTGSLVMIDYSATGRIGDVHDTVQTQFLAAHLDDVAPLVGPGARPSTSPPLPLRPAGEASLLAAAVLGFWMLIRQGQRGRSGGRRGNTRKRLPRWDKRRDASDQPNWASGPIEDLDLFN